MLNLWVMNTETIAAISTAPAMGAISVIGISDANYRNEWEANQKFANDPRKGFFAC